MQVCPALINFPKLMRLAAVSRLALSWTMAGLLPPNSSVSGVRFFAAAAITDLPTGTEPVKKI